MRNKLLLIIALCLLVACVSFVAANDSIETTTEETTEETIEETNTADMAELEELEETEETEDSSNKNIDTDGTITIEVDESQLIDLTPIVVDDDEDAVQYSFTLPLSEEGYWQTSYGDAGEYTVTLSATDGVNIATRDLLLIVNRVNVAPRLKSLLSDLVIKEGETVTLDPRFEDPNGDSMEITISEPLATGTWETDHTSEGEYNIKLMATDGELVTEESFMLTVTNVNELPEITNLADVTVKEGETIDLALDVVDLDGDEVKISISEPFSDDGVWETGYTDNGEYKITITLDDGEDVVSESVSVTVTDVNVAPRIIDVQLKTS